jgi:hypothetical protein
MIRTALHFNVRRYSTMPLDRMAERIGKALGCVFQAGRVNETDAFVAHILGLNVHLYDCLGLGDKRVFALASFLEEDKFLDDADGEQVTLQVQEIGAAISDLLSVRLGGDWHPVTDEEGFAERDRRG